MPFNSILSWLIKKRIKQIEYFRNNPLEVQDQLLANLLFKAKDTEFGKKYHFEKIRSLDDFRANVPIQSYEGFKEYIERLKAGEQYITWPSEINWFAKSSGTTSDKSKYIPVSKETLEECHYKGGKDLVALYYYNHKDTKLYSGKSLSLGGSAEIHTLRKDSYVGDLSSIIIDNLPFWAEMKRVPSKEIALLEDWEEKIDKIAKDAMNENVTNIAGVPSWVLVLLKRILEMNNSDNIFEIWPDLELFMHGGVKFKHYSEQFKKIIPSEKMCYLENYNATEGFFGIQDRPNVDDMLLMLDYGIFYEFIPLENINDPNPDTLTLNEVETDKNYVMVISTNSGLWRYIVGDTIKFTSTFPFRIQVTGRTKHFINAFGEELIIDNANEALTNTCQRLNCIVNEYTAAPIYMTEDSTGSHEWLIEFEKEPEDMNSFNSVLDQELKKANSDYEAKRSYDLTLKPPVIKSLPFGTFYEWMKKRDKLGGQNKIPRLSNHRNYIEDILSMKERETKTKIG